MQPETRFKLSVQKFLKTLPGVFFWKTQERSLRGIPDIVICMYGRFIALELKASARSRVDRLQEHRLNEIRQAFGLAFVVHPGNWPAIKRRLENLTLVLALEAEWPAA